MQIISAPDAMQSLSENLRLQGKRLGVVMTMGALHEGHLSLVTLAQRSSDVVIMTLFVNPTQFGANEDLERYPRPFEHDVAKAEAAGVDYLFAPTPTDIYPAGYQTTVTCGNLAERFEGALRPGHFNGVATVVTKLLHLTKPHVAIFGEKDAQQLAIIRQLATDLNIDVQIIGAPIVREADGLAKSSRNVYLSSEERKRATVLYQALCHATLRIEEGEKNLHHLATEVETLITATEGCTIDYVVFVDEATFLPVEQAQAGKNYRLLLAVRLGSVRLLDNMVMEVK